MGHNFSPYDYVITLRDRTPLITSFQPPLGQWVSRYMVAHCTHLIVYIVGQTGCPVCTWSVLSICLLFCLSVSLFGNIWWVFFYRVIVYCGRL